MKKRYIISLSILGLITAAALSILIPYWAAGEPRYGGNYGPDYTRRVVNNYSNFEDFQNAYYKNVSQFPKEKLFIFDTFSLGIQESYFLFGWHICRQVDGYKSCAPDDEFHFCGSVESFVECTLDGRPFFTREDNYENDRCIIVYRNVDISNPVSDLSWHMLDRSEASEYINDYGVYYGFYDLIDNTTNTILTTLLLPNYFPKDRFKTEISDERYDERMTFYENLRYSIKELVINASREYTIGR